MPNGERTFNNHRFAKIILSIHQTYILRMSSKEIDAIDVLSHQDIIPLILFIQRQGRIIQRQLNEISKGLVRLTKTAERLEDAGLLKITIVNEPRKTVYYELTSKGKAVAEILEKAVHAVEAD